MKKNLIILSILFACSLRASQPNKSDESYNFKAAQFEFEIERIKHLSLEQREAEELKCFFTLNWMIEKKRKDELALSLKVSPFKKS